ncbi:MAG: hypothetical protein SWO11_11195 [Thermodesulfobacteriota bacterium]|nr:hypothetical protein [Thermodesulfobacteriota bacterium]
MVKIPKDPKEIFQDFTKDYKNAFGSDLISIILHGSGASGDYIPKKSDINFLIVLSEKGIEILERSFKIITKWRKRSVNTPLFLTKDYILSSIDTFPVEFFNMKMNYVLVYGEDVLSDLTFEREHMRIECERELKAKLLQLRQGYLQTSHKTGHMQLLIASSITTFIAIFKAILYLKDIKIPAHKDQTLALMCEKFNLNYEIFSTLLNIKKKERKPSRNKMDSLIHEYISEIKRISSIVDTMDITNSS